MIVPTHHAPTRTDHPHQGKGRSAFTFLLLASTFITGCASPQPEPVGGAMSYTDTHVHAVERPEPDGPIHLATHHGLWIQGSDGSLSLVGPMIDLMGYAVLGPEHFIASGHPGPGVDLPEPVGLIESTDGGRTWSQTSRGGVSDFHLLTTSDEVTIGYDGALRRSTDLHTWQEGTTPESVIDLAINPETHEVIATGDGGVLHSTDLGQTWAPWTAAPDLVLLDWVDGSTVIGLTDQGDVAVSTDAGAVWKTHARVPGPVQAMSAGRGLDGGVEVLIATDTEVDVLVFSELRPSARTGPPGARRR